MEDTYSYQLLLSFALHSAPHVDRQLSTVPPILKNSQSLNNKNSTDHWYPKSANPHLLQKLTRTFEILLPLCLRLLCHSNARPRNGVQLLEQPEPLLRSWRKREERNRARMLRRRRKGRCANFLSHAKAHRRKIRVVLIIGRKRRGNENEEERKANITHSSCSSAPSSVDPTWFSWLAPAWLRRTVRSWSPCNMGRTTWQL